MQDLQIPTGTLGRQRPKNMREALSADLFISYAWTSTKHREWVHLLAAQLKALGFDVLLDADVDYGDDLNGFMRRVTETKRVLLIVDENYVERADTLPTSGVGKENCWLSESYSDHEPGWLTALFIDNPGCLLPKWLEGRMPKSLLFNHDPLSLQPFPGSEQVEDLWRWAAGLPASRDSATPISTLRHRAERLERHELLSEPSRWRSPDLVGEFRFAYEDAPRKTSRWGFGASEFAFTVSGHDSDSVYVLKDYGKAVGLVRGETLEGGDLERHLVPGRSVTPRIGQTVVLMNEHGRLSVVEIVDVQRERTDGPYIAPQVTFRWRVIESS